MLLLNTDRQEEFAIAAGDRIAQLVVVRVAEAEPVEVEELAGATAGSGASAPAGAERAAQARATSRAAEVYGLLLGSWLGQRFWLAPAAAARAAGVEGRARREAASVSAL